MNNIDIIKSFIESSEGSKLLVNQVSDEIGLFYINLIENYARDKNIKLSRKDTFIESEGTDLFAEKTINICISNNKNIIEKFINSNTKTIIFTDYKYYKIYSNKFNSINGYNYQKDIENYLKSISVDNFEMINYCLSLPYLTFSELSKFLINKTGYVNENQSKEDTNSILELRKEIFNLKKNYKDLKKIYFCLKKEVSLKKFSFLIY